MPSLQLLRDGLAYFCTKNGDSLRQISKAFGRQNPSYACLTWQYLPANTARQAGWQAGTLAPEKKAFRSQKSRDNVHVSNNATTHKQLHKSIANKMVHNPYVQDSIYM